jgi:soluble lytic murein transglycosylase-like protein
MDLPKKRRQVQHLPTPIVPGTMKKVVKIAGPLVQEALDARVSMDEAEVLYPILISMAYQESRGDPFAISPAGAVGLFQVMPATAVDMGFDPSRLTEVEVSVNAGVSYLVKQLKRFNCDIVLALAAYNAGPGNVLKHQGVPPFKETRDYIRLVLGRVGLLSIAEV